jgi:phosphonate transport system substrate-binding protein
VAIAAILSPQTTRRAYGDLVAYLGERMEREGQMVQGQTYAEVNELLKTGQVDVAFVCTGAYVVAERDFGMELLVVPQVGGETVYRSYIIVPADSSARSLSDLRDKVFAFTDPMSNSGHLAALYMLRQMDETPSRFFRKTIFTYSHDRSIQAVAEKLVDGAAVDSLVYEYPLEIESAYRQKVKVIQTSPPYGIPPVVVHPRLKPEMKAQLRDILLNMHQDEEGKAILAKLHIDRFVLPDESAYDSVRRMLEAVGQWP